MPWSILPFKKWKKKVPLNYNSKEGTPALSSSYGSKKPREKLAKTPVRQGPYGGSKEPSPVTGVVPSCTVIPKEEVISPTTDEGVNLERETAIINRPEKYTGCSRVYLEKTNGSQIFGFQLTRCSLDDGYEQVLLVKNIQDNSVADQSGFLSEGDIILSINGYKPEAVETVESVNELVGECEQSLEMEIQYHVPKAVKPDLSKVRIKTVDVLLHRDRTGFGIVVRGGFNEDFRKCRPLVITHVRKGSPADQEGTIRPGDRLTGVNGFDLSQSSVPEVNDLLYDSGSQAILRIEYDSAIIDTVKRASGPLLVELAKTCFSKLGIALASVPSLNGNLIIIDAIRPASLSDRCGALHTGDQVLAVNGKSVTNLAISEIITLMKMSSQASTNLEILPARQVRKQCGIMSTPSTPYSGIARRHQPPPASVRNLTLNRHESPSNRNLYSSYSTISSRTLSNSHWTRNHHRSRAASVTSLASTISNMSLPFQISRCESATVPINATNHPSGFGFTLYSFDCYPNEPLRTPPVIDFVEPDGPAQKTGLMHVGDRVLSVNDISTIGMTLQDLNEILRDSNGRVSLKMQFDVAESVVPSSGCFTVKLAKCGNRVGFRLYASPYRRSGEGLLIMDVIAGSVAHRTGTISAGDRILSINGTCLSDRSVEEAYQLLRCSNDNIVRLTIEKDDEFSDDGPNAHNMYSVELQPTGGRLGITLTGSDEPFDPITIAAIEPGSIADRFIRSQRMDVLHVNDQIIAIGGSSLRGRTVKDAVAMLQSAKPVIQLKICRRFDYGQQESGFSSMKSECGQNGNWSAESAPHSTQATPQKPDVPHGGSEFYSVSTDPVTELNQAFDGLTTNPETQRPASYMNDHPVSNSNSNNNSLSRLTSTPKHNYPYPQSMKSPRKSRSRSLSKAMNGTLSMRGLPEDQVDYEDSERDSYGSQTRDVYHFSLEKNALCRDFGFSVSNGDDEAGVFINSIRPGGLAEASGLKPLDKLIQINGTKLADDIECEAIVPVIANAGSRVDLLVERKCLPDAPGTGSLTSTSTSLSSQNQDTIAKNSSVHSMSRTSSNDKFTSSITQMNNNTNNNNWNPVNNRNNTNHASNPNTFPNCNSPPFQDEPIPNGHFMTSSDLVKQNGVMK